MSPRRARGWTCNRSAQGVACKHHNPSRTRKCSACGKPRPAKQAPAHMQALALSYEEYVTINGGEACGICGTVQKAGGKRLHRDHDHHTGQPRGILCFRCNAALRPYMTLEWLRSAVAYLERAAATETGSR